ncbi:MAG: class I SAM-dependent methyltransferase [Phycisphaerae bacterium]
MATSATVPQPGQSEADVLTERARAWQARPLLREIYHRYFAQICEHLAEANPPPAHQGGPRWVGRVLELGGGSGNFREYFRAQTTAHHLAGELIASDIVPTPHVDLAADALQLPFPDGSLDNLVMQDVLHHLPYPLAFFQEARRVLRPGGRIVMMEPYISPASRLVFKLAHPEPVIMSAQIFGPETGPDSTGTHDPLVFSGEGAFASNQAIPTLLFYRDRHRFETRFPDLAILVRQRLSCLVYPLSGGFSGPCLLPRPTWPLAWGVERCLTPLAGLLGFRLLVVVEKQAER